MRTLSTLWLAALIVTLGACSLPRPREGEMSIHALTPEVPRHAKASSAAQRPPDQLLVDVPAAGAPLDGDRIAVRTAAGDYGVLRDQRWAETAPRLWQSLLLRALFDDGRRNAGRASAGLAADERLLGELRAFEYLRDEDRVQIRYAAQRVDASGRVRAARLFEADADVRGSEGVDVVAAFEAAAAQLLPELIDWLTAPLADETAPTPR
jgi:cholesterol transport system auxiliary component